MSGHIEDDEKLCANVSRIKTVWMFESVTDCDVILVGFEVLLGVGLVLSWCGLELSIKIGLTLYKRKLFRQSDWSATPRL